MGTTLGHRTITVAAGVTGDLTAVSGLSNLKAIIIKAIEAGTIGAFAGLSYSYGAATSTTQRACVSGFAADNDTPSNTRGAATWNDAVVSFTDATARTGAIDLSAFSATGYTLTVDDALPVDVVLLITEIYSDEVTNIKVGTFTAAGAGSQSITDPGFTPTALHVCSNHGTAFNSMAASANFATGWVIGSASRCMSGIIRGAESNTPNVRSGIRNDAMLSKCSISADSYDNLWTFTSFDANGWTWNHTTGTTASVGWYLAIAGATCKILDTSARTDTNDQAVTGAGFNVSGALLYSRPGIAAYDTAPSPHFEFCFGAGSSASARDAMWLNRKDSDPNNPADMETSTSLVFIDRVTETLTDEGTADYKSSDSDGFTLDQITAATTASVIFAVVFGGAASGSTYTTSNRTFRGVRANAPRQRGSNSLGTAFVGPDYVPPAGGGTGSSPSRRRRRILAN